VHVQAAFPDATPSCFFNDSVQRSLRECDTKEKLDSFIAATLRLKVLPLYTGCSRTCLASYRLAVHWQGAFPDATPSCFLNDSVQKTLRECDTKEKLDSFIAAMLRLKVLPLYTGCSRVWAVDGCGLSGVGCVASSRTCLTSYRLVVQAAFPDATPSCFFDGSVQKSLRECHTDEELDWLIATTWRLKVPLGAGRWLWMTDYALSCGGSAAMADMLTACVSSLCVAAGCIPRRITITLPPEQFPDDDSPVAE